LPKPTSPQIRRSIGFHSLNGRHLVFSLVIGEARREFRIKPIRRRHHRRATHLTFGGDLDQMARNLKQSLLELGLAHLPCATAKLVENRVGTFRPIAREKLDIFDW
jgi:hypothetical protein